MVFAASYFLPKIQLGVIFTHVLATKEPLRHCQCYVGHYIVVVVGAIEVLEIGRQGH